MSHEFTNNVNRSPLGDDSVKLNEVSVLQLPAEIQREQPSIVTCWKRGDSCTGICRNILELLAVYTVCSFQKLSSQFASLLGSILRASHPLLQSRYDSIQQS